MENKSNRSFLGNLFRKKRDKKQEISKNPEASLESDTLTPTPHPSPPSTEVAPKPAVIERVESIVGREFHAANIRGTDNLGGLKPLSKKGPKYAEHEGRIIGLNLAATNLTDAQLHTILTLPDLNLRDILGLNLSENQLTEFRLTPEMGGLRWINLSENPSLTFPADEIIKQGNEAVLRFLKDILYQGEREVFEVKLLIVGEGETGKTTLWHKLQDIDYPVPRPREEQPMTVGISIKEGWSFPHPDREDMNFLVNLWDFGGQEIQYMTHQFFLTPRSFYILLADGRREVGNFPYWLKIIELLGHDPKQANPTPVMVLINTKGNPTPQLPYEPKEVLKNHPKLELIQYYVDFAVNNVALKSLPTTIQEILCTKIPHLPLRIPAYWEAVRVELQAMKQAGVNHIRYEEFEEVCRNNNMEDPQKMRDLSRMLHDLGIILHYQDEHAATLRDFVVLNPHWALDAIYEILKHKELKEKLGRFDQRFLTEVWDNKQYSFKDQSLLNGLMLKNNFEVCFKAQESGQEIYIAPQLLPEHQPDFSWDPGKQSLRYIYRYPFMPKGLIGRLIVRLHEQISTENEKKVLWVKGVKLTQEKREGQIEAEALIKQAEEEGTGGDIIEISISGTKTEDRKFLLKTIRQEFDKLHKDSFVNLKHTELVPCCCDQCIGSQEPYFYLLHDLERLQEENIHVERCKKSLKNVSIKALLEGVFSEREGIEKIDRNPKELIGDDRLEEGIDKLGELLQEDDPLENAVYALQGRMNAYKKKKLEDIMSNEELAQLENKIRIAALELCDKMEERKDKA